MDRSSLIVIVMPITALIALCTGITLPFIAGSRPGRSHARRPLPRADARQRTGAAGRTARPPEPGAHDAARWPTPTPTVAARLSSSSKRAAGTRRRFGPRDGNVLTWPAPGTHDGVSPGTDDLPREDMPTGHRMRPYGRQPVDNIDRPGDDRVMDPAWRWWQLPISIRCHICGPSPASSASSRRTRVRHSPRSRILASMPCSAGWSGSSPTMMVCVPSLLNWRPPNQSAHWSSGTPSTRIS